MRLANGMNMHELIVNIVLVFIVVNSDNDICRTRSLNIECRRHK